VRRLVLLMLAVLGCDERPVELPRERAPALSAQPSDAQRDRARAFLTRLAPSRFETPARREKSCRQAYRADQVRQVVDARLVQKQLLPLSITNQLVEPNVPALESALAEVAGAGQRSVAVERTLALADEKYVSVLHITAYAAPRRIHRLGRRRAEWVPGVLEAWLAVHQLDTGVPLCQTRLLLRNDVTGESVSLRHRSATRERLTQQLGTELAKRLGPAMTRLMNGPRAKQLGAPVRQR
jgi:hypothetical protein